MTTPLEHGVHAGRGHGEVKDPGSAGGVGPEAMGAVGVGALQGPLLPVGGSRTEELHTLVVCVRNDETAIGQESHLVGADQLPRSLTTARHRPDVIAEGIGLQDLLSLPVKDVDVVVVVHRDRCHAPEEVLLRPVKLPDRHLGPEGGFHVPHAPRECTYDDGVADGIGDDIRLAGRGRVRRAGDRHQGERDDACCGSSGDA